jgi:hypothetical protein
MKKKNIYKKDLSYLKIIKQKFFFFKLKNKNKNLI